MGKKLMMRGALMFLVFNGSMELFFVAESKR